MADPETCFQRLILKLQDYWAAKGCVVVQPYDLEVGAGTFHPATTLRALGPGPWRAAYVQPSRRPKDGRYGENPNRLQHYYQFPVILKPSPEESQELYLASLEALGIRLRDHAALGGPVVLQLQNQSLKAGLGIGHLAVAGRFCGAAT